MNKSQNSLSSQQLEMMVRTHQSMLVRYLRYLGAQNAEDLVQETFIRAFQAAKKPANGDVQYEISWLRTIARNLFLTQCRKQDKQTMLYDSGVVKAAESVWLDFEKSEDQGYGYVEALRGCIDQLNDNDRKVLDLRYSQKSSREDMAVSLGMKPEGVKSKLRRLREILGNCVERKLALQEMD